MNGFRHATVITLRTCRHRHSRIALPLQRYVRMCAKNITSIAVFPPSSFIDDTVSVVVSGLAPNTRVSLRSSVQDRDKVFQAVGHFEADRDGKVDLNAQQSLGGSYTGPGPFPAVIDMFGLAGGIIEYRAAMLASKGIVALSLPYCGYEDLPRTYDRLEFEYFEEATAWLSSQSFVPPNAIGIVGTSFGGSVGLEMAARLPQIKAVVAISSLPYILTHMTYRGGKVPSSHPPTDDAQKGYVTKEGFVMKDIFKEDTYNLPDEELIDMQNSGARFLLAIGEDDQNIPAVEGARRMVQKMQSHNQTNYELLSYKGAGHLLEPPFQPLSRGFYNAPLNHVLDFGGEMKAHAHACQDVWSKTLSFLRRHLNDH
ncbi:acyl-coenzyme A amino acid N-acyltransferase 1-like isoform X2 [Patiria miniata]|uniref:BAAT/Acyl-CoA thioester hydrolase C-terminal domain-containing protein n=1 Tax=Patiria miniata TaxID=46514 RepID=A0A914BHK4_PATMI|nr:acyl-coenzyme A amino acid N-acyltransferase 1-like isoform X2 [Patiria miniata]